MHSNIYIYQAGHACIMHVYMDTYQAGRALYICIYIRRAMHIYICTYQAGHGGSPREDEAGAARRTAQARPRRLYAVHMHACIFMCIYALGAPRRPYLCVCMHIHVHTGAPRRRSRLRCRWSSLRSASGRYIYIYMCVCVCKYILGFHDPCIHAYMLIHYVNARAPHSTPAQRMPQALDPITQEGSEWLH